MRMRQPEKGVGAGLGKSGFYTRGWGWGKGRERVVYGFQAAFGKSAEAT